MWTSYCPDRELAPSMRRLTGCCSSKRSPPLNWRRVPPSWDKTPSPPGPSGIGFVAPSPSRRGLGEGDRSAIDTQEATVEYRQIGKTELQVWGPNGRKRPMVRGSPEEQRQVVARAREGSTT